MAEARKYVEKLLNRVLRCEFELKRDVEDKDVWFMYEFEYPCEHLAGFRNVGVKCAISVNRTVEGIHVEYLATVPKADTSSVSLEAINTFNRENILQMTMVYERDDNGIKGICVRQVFHWLSDMVDVSAKFVFFAQGVLITYSKEVLAALGIDESGLMGKA